MPTPPFVLDLRKKIGPDLLYLPSIDAVVFDPAGRVLLQRRADSGRWSLVSGIMDPGEPPAAAVVREVMEEAAVACVPERVSGVYTTPVITYSNGDRAQYVVITFVCRAVDGREPRVNDDESLEVRYFRLDEVPDLRDDHRRKLDDALSGRPTAFDPPA